MLTDPQKLIIKDYIANTPELDSLQKNSDGSFEVAKLLNLPADPEWIVWKTSISRKEILHSDLNWTKLTNEAVGKIGVWNAIFGDSYIDPSNPNIRSAVDAIWSGDESSLGIRDVIYTKIKAKASLVQKLFSTGEGSDASPATMDSNINENYKISYSDIETARNS